MSFGWHIAKAAAAAAEADEELENSFRVSSFLKMKRNPTTCLSTAAPDVISIASSAASKALEEARAEVVKLRTKKYLMEQQIKQQAKVISPTKILHDKIIKDNADSIDAIMNMDICSLWWCEQWVQERMAVLGKTDTQKLNSYKTWV